LTGPSGIGPGHTERQQCKEREMAYTITDECTACGTCKETCPSEAIKEGEKKYSIDAEVCIDCGACLDACPAKAIKEA
jgi:formate hydrogenlyase subunit 6/NADH:ubiquinone oxidoreductase subunit I